MNNFLDRPYDAPVAFVMSANLIDFELPPEQPGCRVTARKCSGASGRLRSPARPAGSRGHHSATGTRTNEPGAFRVRNRCVQGDNLTMRAQFHHRLGALRGRLVGMCELAGDAINQATDALVHNDPYAAGLATGQCELIEASREPCERLALSLLALQAPVGEELRQVVTAIQMVGDLARMGGLAQHVANVARRRHPNPLPEHVVPLISRIGEAGADLTNGACEVLRTADPGLAVALTERDEILDGLHRELLDTLTKGKWSGDIATVVDITLLGRFYERFGDHAVQLGRRMIFLATGTPALDYVETIGAQTANTWRLG